jgi:hypothetical protein
MSAIIEHEVHLAPLPIGVGRTEEIRNCIGEIKE